MNKKLHPLCSIGFVLLITGGINWGFVGLFDFNLINTIFWKVPLIERLVYLSIGLSAIGIVVEVISRCRINQHKEESAEEHKLSHA